jgi:hypothetical protein
MIGLRNTYITRTREMSVFCLLEIPQNTEIEVSLELLLFGPPNVFEDSETGVE